MPISFRGALGIAVGVVVCLTFIIPQMGENDSTASISKRRMRRAILFGDSITQEGSDPTLQGWVAALTSFWIRRVDVINRGFGGYNTRWAIKIYDRVVIEQHPDIIFIFFGANDAVVSEHKQHVPLDEYKENIITMVRKAKDISATIFLLTPPPVFEPVLEERNKEKGKVLLNDRINLNTLKYADACKEVGKIYEVPVIDNWSTMGGNGNNRGDYLRDGLHLSKMGNQQLYTNIVNVIESKFEELKAESLPLFQPHWSEVVEDPSILL
jgi:isoamyl acetate esterase